MSSARNWVCGAAMTAMSLAACGSARAGARALGEGCSISGTGRRIIRSSGERKDVCDGRIR